MGPREIIARFARIVEQELARVRPRLRYVTLDIDDLRSRGHEALIVGYARFEPTRGELEPWLRYFVRHRLADALGARAVQRREDGIADVESVVNGANPEELVLARERPELVQAVFGGLPPRQYAIVCAMIAGHTVRETAASLGISVSRVHRERKRAFAVVQRRWNARATDD